MSIICLIFLLCLLFQTVDGEQSCMGIQDEDLCIDDCLWCSDIDDAGFCSSADAVCPGPNGGPDESCMGIQDEDLCIDDCLWCSDIVLCSSVGAGCPGPNGGPDESCMGIQDEDLCIDDCLWCSDIDDAGFCSSVGAGCPGPNGPPGDPNDGNNTNSLCFPLTNETECLANGCFFCAEKGLCRLSEEKCPPGANGGANGICNPLKNETDCTNAECHFCAEKGLCRASEAQCPGNGRFNPCKNQTESECSATDTCLWCNETNVCTGARGARCPSAGGINGTIVGQGDLCVQFADEDQCTSGSTSCRWCPDETKCKKGHASCDDGSSGIRGNPCNAANSTDECSSVPGCLWCQENNKCKKVTDGCESDDDNLCRAQNSTDSCSSVDSCLWCNITSKCRNETIGCDVDGAFVQNKICRRLEYQVDCEENTDCQWCADQEKCKRLGAECDLASGEVDLDIDYGTAKFSLRNDGLGNTDPNQISVKIAYLFEIGDDGETEIGSSFIDLENQEFNVEQVQDFFFGGILARRIAFDASVDGVGDIELEVFFMLANGTITTPAGEVFEVNEGDVKFNVNMFNWTFCDAVSNPCGNGTETSQYIDVAAEILGSESIPEEDETGSMVFNLGGGIPLLLSNQIKVDGEIDAMPLGFPRVENSDQGTVFIFRFPRFESTVEYDPIVQTEAMITITPPPTSPPSNLPSTSPSGAPTTAAPTQAPTARRTTAAPQAAPDGGNSIESGSAVSEGAIVGISFTIVLLIAFFAIYRLLRSDKSSNSAGKDHDRTRDTFADEDFNLSGRV